MRIQPKPVRGAPPAAWAIGHRGFPTAAPENTLESFERAIEAGADMVEFDVALTKDGVPVVIHDAKVGRTTDGKGTVSEMDWEELRKLDAGRWFSREFAGERIPSLEEVLELTAHRISLNVEIKEEAVTKAVDGGVEAKVVQTLEKFGLVEFTVVSSFSRLAIERVKKLAPTQSTALLLPRAPAKGVRAILAPHGADALHVSTSGLTEKLVKEARAEGIPLRIYTVNGGPQMREYLDWGVDGIFTDRIDQLVAVLKSTASSGNGGAGLAK